MKKPNLFQRFIYWWKVYYWNVVNDLPRDRKRSKRDMLRWVFLHPWYKFLAMLNRAGFMNTPEGTYMSIFDFTPFFWRTLVDRAVEAERRYWKHELVLAQEHNSQLLEEARRRGSEEVYEYLINRIDTDFGRRT